MTGSLNTIWNAGLTSIVGALDNSATSLKKLNIGFGWSLLSDLFDAYAS